MNLPAIHPTAQPGGKVRQAGTDRRHGEAFARVLDRKSAALADDGDTACAADQAPAICARPIAMLLRRFDHDSDPNPTDPVAVGAPAIAASLPAATLDAASAPVVGVLPDSLAAPRAAFEAALEGMPLPASAAAAQAATWEASVREPSGVAIELRAARGDGPAGWTLTIASSGVEAALLARHAPRLSERLRARALADTHVRIERDDREDA
jgi:hypothetical protein